MLHVPLGVLGFVVSCALGVLLLRWTGSSRLDSEELTVSPEIDPDRIGKFTPAGRVARNRSAWRKSGFDMSTADRVPPQGVYRDHGGHSTSICAGIENHDQAYLDTSIEQAAMDTQQTEGSGGKAANVKVRLPRPAWLAPLLAGVLLATSLLYTPRPAAAAPALAAPWSFQTGLETEPWPLSQGELDWLGSTGALSGDRWRFSWGDVTGTMLFVRGNSWRAQHRPERCFEVYGLAVENSRTYLAASDFPLQLLVLGNGSGRELNSAAYWFQSRNQITSDYGARIWSDLAPDRESWVLVTVLLDDVYSPDEGALTGLYQAIRESVAHSLGEGALQ
jgi:hypothetical protein